jgi:protein gp37
MGDRSSIEWTEATWNPVTGCDRVSPGCDNCYAERLAKRLQAMGNARYANGFAVTLHPDMLDLPLRWRTPRRVFVNSMSDLFHPKVPADFVEQVFEVMATTPQHTYQVLTKRPKRARQLLRGWTPTPNAWLGVSIEEDSQVDRAEILREVPAAIRFLSCEPLLGPLPSLDLTDINWVIVGGESGPDFRPMQAEWAASLRNRCLEAGIHFFFKQWGGRTPKSGGRQLDGRTWDEFPRGPTAPLVEGC